MEEGNSSHQCEILLCDKQNWERWGVSWILSHGRDGSRFLHKASTGCFVSEVLQLDLLLIWMKMMYSDTWQDENGLANKSKLSHRSVLSIKDSNNDDKHMENVQTSTYGPHSLVSTEVANGRSSCSMASGRSSCLPTREAHYLSFCLV
jgi:hypothetical protein